MGLVVRVKIEGARETLAAFRRLPKEASAELRDANQELSDELASKISAAASSSDAQSALVAGSVRSRRDRVPSVVAGGSKRVGRNKKPVGKILFGANFGATYLKQFRPHQGAGDEDYWFFSTVEENEERIAGRWNEAADKILSQWGRHG